VTQYALQQADRVRQNVGGGKWLTEVDNVQLAMRELDDVTADVEGLRAQRTVRSTAVGGRKEQM